MSALTDPIRAGGLMTNEHTWTPEGHAPIRVWSESDKGRPLYSASRPWSHEEAIIEILRLAAQSSEHEMLSACLLGALGLNREAMDREALPVGNSILETVRALRAEVDGHRREMAEGEAERERLWQEVERLKAERSAARAALLEGLDALGVIGESGRILINRILSE